MKCLFDDGMTHKDEVHLADALTLAVRSWRISRCASLPDIAYTLWHMLRHFLGETVSIEDFLMYGSPGHGDDRLMVYFLYVLTFGIGAAVVVRLGQSR